VYVRGVGVPPFSAGRLYIRELLEIVCGSCKDQHEQQVTRHQ